MIRKANREDIFRCMDERSIKNAGFMPNDVNGFDFIVCEQDRCAMLAYVIGQGASAEVHIICPKDSIIRSRSMCSELMSYLRFLGFFYVTTRILNEYKTAHNMVRKLGLCASLSTAHETFYWGSLCR